MLFINIGQKSPFSEKPGHIYNDISNLTHPTRNYTTRYRVRVFSLVYFILCRTSPFIFINGISLYILLIIVALYAQ